MEAGGMGRRCHMAGWQARRAAVVNARQARRAAVVNARCLSGRPRECARGAVTSPRSGAKGLQCWEKDTIDDNQEKKQGEWC
jgi:hypothetical protein